MIVDCDCHNYWSSAEVLLTYLDEYHRDYFTRGEQPGPRGSSPDANRPWLHPEGLKRMDINPETQEDHYRIMMEKHLDAYSIDYLDAMYGRETLMFASDYPHWDYDDVQKLQIPPEWGSDVLGNNAMQVYRRLQDSNATETAAAVRA